MIKFFVEEAQEDTFLTIHDDAQGVRIQVEAEQLNDLRRAVNKALKNISKYSSKTFGIPHSEMCWAPRGDGLPCLRKMKECEHRKLGVPQHPELWDEDHFRQEVSLLIRRERERLEASRAAALGQPPPPGKAPGY